MAGRRHLCKNSICTIKLLRGIDGARQVRRDPDIRLIRPVLRAVAIDRSKHTDTGSRKYMALKSRAFELSNLVAP